MDKHDISFKRDIYDELVKWKEKAPDKVLQLNGARQVGKTYILNKFAGENFKHSVYINMAEPTGTRFLAILDEEENNIKDMSDVKGPVEAALKRYDPSFRDEADILVIFDEIQESAKIYNYLRPFARRFDCRIAVTGSYLGRLIEKDFFLPAGDTYSLTLETLSFREFTDIFGLRKIYDDAEIFAETDENKHKALKACFDLYQEIGGYPSVVKRYLETKDLEECRLEKKRLIDIFTEESKRYFEDVLDTEMFDQLFNAIAISLIREKRGAGDLIEELSDIVYKQESGRVTKKSVNHAIAWLRASHIIDYAGMSIDCDYLQIKENARFYFMDVGIAYYFLSRTGAEPDTVRGLVAENFVYRTLYSRIGDEIAGSQPWFAVYPKVNGELDFYVRSLKIEP